MALGNGIRYAKDRKAFGKSISEFGLIQEKIANCAVGVFVGEALCYRTVGMIDGALAAFAEDKNDTEDIQKPIEDYAVECSIVKVWASEMLDIVVDEVLQIFAGYGYVEEYPAERAYRDSRINRIFEGTNEINRLIITGWLMKSAMSGKLALMPAIKKLMDEVMAGPSEKKTAKARSPTSSTCSPSQEADPLRRRSRHAKVHAAACRRAGGHGRHRRHDHRGLRHGVRDSPRRKDRSRARERSGALSHRDGPHLRRQGMSKIELAARKVIAAVAEGDMLRTQLTILRRLSKHDPADTIALRRQVAKAVIQAGKYSL